MAKPNTNPTFEIINGSPYVHCGRCGELVKLFGVYSISFGHFIRVEVLTKDEKGNAVLKVKRELSIRKAHGCLNCFDRQAREQAGLKAQGKSWRAFYPETEAFNSHKAKAKIGVPND